MIGGESAEEFTEDFWVVDSTLRIQEFLVLGGDNDLRFYDCTSFRENRKMRKNQPRA